MIPVASISIRSSGRNSAETATSVEQGKSPRKNSLRAFQNCGWWRMSVVNTVKRTGIEPERFAGGHGSSAEYAPLAKLAGQ